MANNRSGFAGLTRDNCGVIGGFCDTETLDSLTKASRTGHAFFKQPLRRHGAAKLLKLIADGNELAAEKLIAKNPQLLLEYAAVTDEAGRHFASLTPLQYALWAQDFHLWGILLRCLPVNDKGKLTLDSKKILASLRSQYNQFTNDGVSYDQYGHTTLHDHSNPLAALIYACQHYVDTFATMTADERKDYWIKVIGSKEKNLTTNTLQLLCNNDAPFHQSDFSANSRSLNIEPYFQKDMLSLSPIANSELGSKFAILPKDITGPSGLVSPPSKGIVEEFLTGLHRLNETRIAETNKLAQLLQAPAQKARRTAGCTIL